MINNSIVENDNKWRDQGSEVDLFVLIILQKLARVYLFDVIFSHEVFFPVFHADLKDSCATH